MITNYLTIDVEDYYQVTAFEKVIKRDCWHQYESRVERNTRLILSLLEERKIKATFFVLGWTAEKFPDLITEISRHGHEIACHSYEHRLIYTMSEREFIDDTKRAKDILENITGKKVAGYRGPSYSITPASLWAFDCLAKLGFEYDSSIFPINHDIYGFPRAPRFQYTLTGRQMVEYPLSTWNLLNYRIPVAGGGYFRLLPYWFIKQALKSINEREQQPFIFYFHPWEIDPAQPRVPGISARSRFRHYTNLGKTLPRLNTLLTDFRFQPIKPHV